MKENFVHTDLTRLSKELMKLMKEANLLGIINKKLAKQRLERAHCVALQITALRFMN